MSSPFARAFRARRRVDRAVRWAVEPLESRLLLSAVSWTGTGDGVNWTDPNNWSGHALPGASDDVSIAAGFAKVQLVSGTQTINSLTSASPFTLSGGTLAVETTFQTAANVTLAGGTLLGGAVTSSGGASLSLTANSTLSGVTLGSNLTIPDGVLSVQNGLTLANGATVTLDSTGYNGDGQPTLMFQGSQTLGGSGSVVLGGTYWSAYVYAQGNGGSSPATLTIGPGMTISQLAGSTVNGYMQGYYPSDGIVNQGTIDANVAGRTINLNNGTLANAGMLEASGGTLSFNGALTESSTSTLYESPTGHINLGGSLTASNTGPASFQTLGSVSLTGGGTPSSPQQVEVMSQDLGTVAAGYTDNFAYGSLTINNNDYVKLTDLVHNSSGTGAEALYVNSLVIGSGATLNLNGLHVYARATQNSGTITNGTLSQIPVGGQLPLDLPLPADLSTAGELDQWSFFDHGGQTVPTTLTTRPGGFRDWPTAAATRS